MKLINLLLLNYSNTSVSPPSAFKNWDLDFHLMIFFVTTFLFIVSFGAGWLIQKFFKIPPAERISLTYGLGMNNNRSGLVLASSAMADHSLIMLPIIFYNLGQQIVAGIFNSKLLRSNTNNRKD
jgi:BASS family bile acid:Na+ symporter